MSSPTGKRPATSALKRHLDDGTGQPMDDHPSKKKEFVLVVLTSFEDPGARALKYLETCQVSDELMTVFRRVAREYYSCLWDRVPKADQAIVCESFRDQAWVSLTQRECGPPDGGVVTAVFDFSVMHDIAMWTSGQILEAFVECAAY